MNLVELKKIKCQQINSIASSMLKKYDWMASRAFEGGSEIPLNIVEYRSSIRAKSNNLVDLVNECTNEAQLMELEVTIWNVRDPNEVTK